jgi:WhiB family redox-sensing transcriptional regulator
MSRDDGNASAKLPHRGLQVTVSSRRRETPAGSSNDRRGEITEKNWQEFASCRGKPTSLFFPLRTDPATVRKEAVATCHRCPVKRRCLMLAVEHEERDDYGIFGGTSPNERRTLRRMVRSQEGYLLTQEATERYGLHGAY